ncbi:ParA family protein [Halopelagius fulvigenes]|uniref:ParA family protein n=1 Tax=Halopelagius fulvigenes TaxID=1198324 RepID=A0ABD5U2E6_9EURY
MTVKLAVSNQKGGVAKSTNALNVAGALASKNNNVLLVDTDPQGFATRTLGFTGEYNTQTPNLADAMNEPTDYDIQDIILEHAEFDVLPSNVSMFSLQQDLIAAGWKPRERLMMLFEQLEGEYDYIIVDAPPSLGVINDNVLLACQNMIIPVEAMESSIHALDILLNQIETLEERYGVEIKQSAIVISNIHYPLDNDQKENIEFFRDTFEGRCPVHKIRHRAAVKRSLSAGGSIFGEEAEDTDMKENYLQLAEDVEEESEVMA